MTQIQANRDFMKCPFPLGDSMKKSDQQAGVAHPPHGKPSVGNLISLKSFETNCPVTNDSYKDLLDIRRSVRVYDENAPMTQEQLAFLLYSIQGIQSHRGSNSAFTLRPVPSGGARHPFEVYIAVRNVDGLEKGIYRYVPTENIGGKAVTVEFLKNLDNHEEQIADMVVGQRWVIAAPVVLFISCVPYKAEWRYVEHAHRIVLVDLGHVGQNAMLSAVALGLGSCCLGAYNQQLCDQLLGLDGQDEYTVYGISVGKETEKTASA
ncbi:MAG: SagB/ThcOx family dehydrogenase [Defluviitaleaceae bacterium]|nr:SagB/ThcOx family dehydrogenase [Defluviitaleaceae bacterium]